MPGKEGDGDKLFSSPVPPPLSLLEKPTAEQGLGGRERGARHSPLQRSLLGPADLEALVAPKERRNQWVGKRLQ